MQERTRERILIIEDERDIAQLLSLYLGMEGFESVIVHRGWEGIEQAERIKPHLILLDVALPDVDGWEVCRQLRKRTDVPIIFITGFQEIDHMTHGLEIGANDYLVKPFDGKILAARIRAHLRQTPHLESQPAGTMLAVKPIFGPPPTDNQYKADIFVIMPFADALYPVYSYVIQGVAEFLGLKVVRGDDFFSHHAIMTDIWGAIYGARLVIADCTGRNPNVFYELGIAHTLGKKTIMITQNQADIPFDLQAWRYIKYQYNQQGLKNLEKELIYAIERLLKKEE